MSIKTDASLNVFDLLLSVLSDVSHIKVYDDVTTTLKNATKKLINCDASSIILKDGDQCHYIDEDSAQPLWKGMKFPLDDCISGWAIKNESTAVVPDIYDDARVPSNLYKHTLIKSMLVSPLKNQHVHGAISVYWTVPHQPSPTEIHILETLANVSSLVFDYFILQSKLDKTVESKTFDLNTVNQKLVDLAIQDDLTSLYNRRGFFLMGNQAIKASDRIEKNCILSYIDIDGLKEVNDRYGHKAGDRMIKSVANILKGHFRKSDIVARLGGDEFAVLIVDPEENGENIHARLAAEIKELNSSLKQPFQTEISIGSVYSKLTQTSNLEELINQADKLMYKEKKRKKSQN